MHTPRNIQAPNDAADFWGQWNSTTPRMALFIKITPQSFWTGVSAVGITSNTRDMTLPGHPGMTFKSAPGITPTVCEQALGEPANLEMTGVYQTGIFEQADVAAGKWNFSTVEVFSASWEHPEYGELVHAKCKMGEVKDYQTYFTAEARGLMSLLSNDVNKVTSRFCRVKEFRDAECGHTASTVTIASVVYDIEQDTVVFDHAGELIETDATVLTGNPPPDDFFKNGKLTATSGVNNGVSREIASSQILAGSLYLKVKRPFPFDLQAADTVHLIAGCTRTIEDCMKYDNIINRRAEDWIPGIEAVNRVPPSN